MSSRWQGQVIRIEQSGNIEYLPCFDSGFLMFRSTTTSRHAGVIDPSPPAGFAFHAINMRSEEHHPKQSLSTWMQTYPQVIRRIFVPVYSKERHITEPNFLHGQHRSRHNPDRASQNKPRSSTQLFSNPSNLCTLPPEKLKSMPSLLCLRSRSNPSCDGTKWKRELLP